MKLPTTAVLVISLILMGCVTFKYMIKVQCAHQDFQTKKCLVYPRISKEKKHEDRTPESTVRQVP